MLFEIDHHSGVPIYQQIIRQIRRQIMTGCLKAGDQLETVRDLSARLKVNPMTISKAYSFLEAEKLVERKRGIGLFVADIEQNQKEQTKDRLLDDAVNIAVIAAIQFGISENKVIELFIKQYREYRSRIGEKND